MRLAPSDGCQIGQTNRFDAFYGGSEANVAAALAQYGENTSFVSILPNNPVGRDALRKMQYYGVNTEYLKFATFGRMGIYYLEPGVGECSRVCTYDRANSSLVMAANTGVFDWEKIFKGASLFHFSGITPALSPALRQICSSAISKAHEMGLLVSCDVNYRSKLWTKKEAAAVMKDLAFKADILFINEEEASVLGFNAHGEYLMDLPTFSGLTSYLCSKADNVKVITSAARVHLADGGLAVEAKLWSTSDHLHVYSSKVCPLKGVIDPNGAGDAYAAAVLYGLLHNVHLEKVVNWGAAAASLKHYCRGDVNLASLEDIKALAEKDISTGLKR